MKDLLRLYLIACFAAMTFALSPPEPDLPVPDSQIESTSESIEKATIRQKSFSEIESMFTVTPDQNPMSTLEATSPTLTMEIGKGQLSKIPEPRERQDPDTESKINVKNPKRTSIPTTRLDKKIDPGWYSLN